MTVSFTALPRDFWRRQTKPWLAYASHIGRLDYQELGVYRGLFWAQSGRRTELRYTGWVAYTHAAGLLTAPFGWMSIGSSALHPRDDPTVVATLYEFLEDAPTARALDGAPWEIHCVCDPLAYAAALAAYKREHTP